MNVFTILKPPVIRLPVVLSIPHAGTFIPTEIAAQLKQNVLPPDDTDWFVDKLYSFAHSLGIPTIIANYSRWVIDLNRNPDDTPLYHDKRVITGLCTATNFNGEHIYADEKMQVNASEVNRRRDEYFAPYHIALQQLLHEVKTQFGSVLLWDCHSIRRLVPSIYPTAFPDLILGSADSASASQNLIQKTISLLSNSPYSFSHNYPFKGGYITRHYGKPDVHQHALQLEMVKPLYMNDSEQLCHTERADAVRELLMNTLSELGKSLL